MMLPSRHYVSEHTKFIRELLAQKPELVEKQREGRAIWWDKTPRALADEAKRDAGRVPQSGYVYDGKD
ncbi:MAG: DUF3460 family protein [Casimicrobiaceae bacterium]